MVRILESCSAEPCDRRLKNLGTNRPTAVRSVSFSCSSYSLGLVGKSTAMSGDGLLCACIDLDGACAMNADRDGIDDVGNDVELFTDKIAISMANLCRFGEVMMNTLMRQK